MPTHTYHLIPHTHWDREWYLTRAAFTVRLVPALDDLIARLHADAGFRTFLLDGQTVLVEDYLRTRPDMRDTVAALVREGRLQVGPWYVLADELIPSGESLVRNLLAGRADAEQLGAPGPGGRLDVLYSPDAFGHPASWPALAREFGIRYGVLWRGLGGEPGQERDLYRWADRAGREIVLYHLPPDGYEVGSGLEADPARLASAWQRLAPGLRARAATGQIAVFVGADHHAAHPAVGALRGLLSRLEPQAEVRVSRLDEFLEKAAAEAPALPLLQGELRWSYRYTWTLQGVHGTRAPLKRRHAEAELLLERIAEPLAALDRWERRRDAGPVLGAAWRTLLRSQFHDSIGGCTADGVARRVEARIGDAATMAGEIARACFHSLAGYDPDTARAHPGATRPRLVLWNPAPRRRGGVAIADLTWFRRDVPVGPADGRAARRAAPPTDAAIAASVAPLPHQLLGRRRGQERLDAPRHYPDQDEVEVARVAIAVPELDGFGFVGPDAGAAPLQPVGLVAGGLGNGILEVGCAPNGRVWLRDRRSGVLLDRLLGLESEPDAGDTYSFARGAGRLTRAAPWHSARPLAAGPLVGALEASTTLLGGRVTARIVLTLHAGSPALRCTLELDNRAIDHRLRLRIPVGRTIAETLAGSSFGAVRRRSSYRGAGPWPREAPVTTAPAQRFVLAPAAGPGLAVLAPGFFEYEAAGADLLITLLRAVGQLSRDDLPTRPGHAGWPTPTPEAQCLGVERLQLALCPIPEEAAGREDLLAQLWEDCFLPPRAVWLRQATELEPPAAGLRLEGAGLVFSALKPACEGGGIVVRCYNPADLAVEGCLTLAAPAGTAARVRADERGPVPLRLEGGGRRVRFTAGAGEIVTLMLTPA